MLSANSFNLDRSMILLFAKELIFIKVLMKPFEIFGAKKHISSFPIMVSTFQKSNVTHHMKRDLKGIAKNIDPCQTAQS